MANNLSLNFLPNPGAGRLWVVEFNPKSRTQPMVIRLKERYARGKRGASTTIGFDYATANQKDLANKAEEILERVSDYAKFVGEFEHEEKSE